MLEEVRLGRGGIGSRVPVGLSGRKHLKTPRRLWKIRASLLNMFASMSVNRSISTSLHMHSHWHCLCIKAMPMWIQSSRLENTVA